MGDAVAAFRLKRSRLAGVIFDWRASESPLSLSLVLFRSQFKLDEKLYNLHLISFCLFALISAVA